jgi:hypothetical protein
MTDRDTSEHLATTETATEPLFFYSPPGWRDDHVAVDGLGYVGGLVADRVTDVLDRDAVAAHDRDRGVASLMGVPVTMLAFLVIKLPWGHIEVSRESGYQRPSAGLMWQQILDGPGNNAQAMMTS